MAFTYITLTTGSGYRDATGAIPVTRIRARPLEEMTNGTITLAKEVIIPIGDDGTATRDLAATTDPGTTPAGNAYRFRVESGGQIVRTFIAELPHDAPGGEIDLADLDELTAGPNLVNVYSLVTLTQAAYDALPSPDEHTLYAVID